MRDATPELQDAVAQARDGVWGALEDWQNTTRTTAQVHRDLNSALDALIAAVRAECAAKVRAVPTIGNTPSDAQFFADKMRDKILAALEAQP